MTYKGYIVARLPDGRIKIEGYAPMTEEQIRASEWAGVLKLL